MQIHHRKDSQYTNVQKARVEWGVNQGEEFAGKTTGEKQSRTLALYTGSPIEAPQMLTSKGWSVLGMKGFWVSSGRCMGKNMVNASLVKSSLKEVG